MPELLVFIVINAISLACIALQYFIKNTISAITSHDIKFEGERHVSNEPQHNDAINEIFWMYMPLLYRRVK